MVQFPAGDTLTQANSVMQVLLKQTHLVKRRVLELEERQLQSLLEILTPALSLTMV
tara:strand:- start:327 stop:494 length:168 start_codon:yes stop_codon:yes gene_type:complete